MTKRRLLDTNLIIRHLVQDDERLAKIAGNLINASDRGDITLILLPTVLAESVFVLESFYERDRSDIAGALSTLISSPGIEIDDPEIHLDALARYMQHNLHFVDCLLAAHAVSKNLAVATLDKQFKKFGDVEVAPE